MMRYKNFLAKVALLSLVLGLVAVIGPVRAANFTSMSDTMSRQAAGETATHDIAFTLPATASFDIDGSTDTLTFNFTDTFSVGGTWATTDFAFDDGASVTIATVDTTYDNSLTCSGDSVGVEIDTASADFRIIPCDAYGGSATGATLNFDIYGASPDGTLTNPSASSVDLALSMTDEGSAAAHSGTIQLSIPDGDQITINAEVESTMVFDLDVGVATGADSSTTPYTVDLGTLDTAAVDTSGDGTINMIGVDISANATGGVVITVKNANGAEGLASTSAGPDAGASDSDDDIEVATGTLSAGSEGYGICVHRVYAGQSSTLQTSTNDFVSTQLSSTNTSPDLSTTCDASTHNLGGNNLSDSAQNILTSNSGPISGGRAEIFVKAAISNTTPAHNDYTDTLTFIATGTY